MKQELEEVFSVAINLRDAGDLHAAKQTLVELSKLDATSPAIFTTLGDVYWEMELREEAIKAFQEALLLKPKLEAASLGLFHCLWELGRREEAFEELKRFQTVSYSENYDRIVKEINEKFE